MTMQGPGIGILRFEIKGLGNGFGEMSFEVGIRAAGMGELHSIEDTKAR